MKSVFALSLDGGGIKGIIQASLLSRVEIPDDLVLSGTSIGSGNAAMLAVGIRGLDIEDRFLALSDTAFQRSIFRRISPVGAKFSGRGLDTVLQQTFGETMLSDVREPIFITGAYLIEGGYREKVFDSVDHEDDAGWKLWEVCRVSMAAPYYFPPYRRSGLRWIDGGVWANNPSLVLAFGIKNKLHFDFREVRLFSMANGHSRPEPLRGNPANWTALKWGHIMIKEKVAANIRTAHRGAQLLGLAGYRRFEEPSGIDRWQMDSFKDVLDIRDAALKHVDEFKKSWYEFWDRE